MGGRTVWPFLFLLRGRRGWGAAPGVEGSELWLELRQEARGDERPARSFLVGPPLSLRGKPCASSQGHQLPQQHEQPWRSHLPLVSMGPGGGGGDCQRSTHRPQPPSPASTLQGRFPTSLAEGCLYLGAKGVACGPSAHIHITSVLKSGRKYLLSWSRAEGGIITVERMFKIR